jgi:hypothetical protein
MFKQVVKANCIGTLMKRHNQCLVICDQDERLSLLPVTQSRYNWFCVAPINGATITLTTPDSETVIDAGNGDESEIEITGQGIVTLYSDGKWYVLGNSENSQAPVQEKRPRGRPRKEPALTA